MYVRYSVRGVCSCLLLLMLLLLSQWVSLMANTNCSSFELGFFGKTYMPLFLEQSTALCLSLLHLKHIIFLGRGRDHHGILEVICFLPIRNLRCSRRAGFFCG